MRAHTDRQTNKNLRPILFVSCIERSKTLTLSPLSLDFFSRSFSICFAHLFVYFSPSAFLFFFAFHYRFSLTFVRLLLFRSLPTLSFSYCRSAPSPSPSPSLSPYPYPIHTLLSFHNIINITPSSLCSSLFLLFFFPFCFRIIPIVPTPISTYFSPQ